MKYKVGDKVRVIEDLYSYTGSTRGTWDTPRQVCVGREYIIRKAEEDCYVLDNHCYFWHESSLVPVEGGDLSSIFKNKLPTIKDSL